MSVRIACKDVGINCDFVAEAATEEELLKKVAEHARHVHGLANIDAATLAKVKSAIQHK